MAPDLVTVRGHRRSPLYRARTIHDTPGASSCLKYPGVGGAAPPSHDGSRPSRSGGGAAMRDTELFGMALGIEPPWVVTKSEFDAAAKRLDIHLDFAKGSRFACSECGVAGCPAYDSENKTWRHLNFFRHEAYLHDPGRGRLAAPSYPRLEDP